VPSLAAPVPSLAAPVPSLAAPARVPFRGGVVVPAARRPRVSATAQSDPRVLPARVATLEGMNRTTKTITSLVVTGAAALGVVGCGSSSSATTTQAAAITQATRSGQAAQGTQSSQAGQGTAAQAGQGTPAQADQGRGGPALSTADLATAAKALGTTSTKLQAAMDAARPAGRPSTTSGTTGSGAASGSDGDPRTAMYAAIAKALGTTSAKVQAALADRLPAGGPGGGGAAGRGGTPPSGAA
jgi:hypothetical protein